MTADSDRARGLVVVTVGVIVLSPDTLLIRLIETDHWTLLCSRGFLVALALGGYIVVRERGGTVAQFRALGALGLLTSGFYALSTILFVNSVRLTAVSNTLVILSAMPLVAAILGRTCFGETLPRRTWIASLVTLCGIAVIFSGSLDGGAFVGDLSALGTTAAMAAVLVILRHDRQINALAAMSLGGLIGGIATLPAATPSAIDARDLVLLLLLGLVVVPVAFGLITLGPRYLPAPEVSLIMLLEALLGPLWVWLVIGEIPPRETVLGGIVVLGALVVHFAAGLWGGRRMKNRIGTET
jgi:drug/metabolite transporter (DMT)-like permease